MTTTKTTTSPRKNSQLKPKRKQPRREIVAIRRLNRARRLIEIAQDLKQHFFEFAGPLEVLIHTVETKSGRTRERDVEIVLVAIAEQGCWTVEDIIDWITRRLRIGLSRRVVDAILGDLVASGLVKKSKARTGQKGRPAYIYEAIG